MKKCRCGREFEDSASNLCLHCRQSRAASVTNEKLLKQKIAANLEFMRKEAEIKMKRQHDPEEIARAQFWQRAETCLKPCEIRDELFMPGQTKPGNIYRAVKQW